MIRGGRLFAVGLLLFPFAACTAVRLAQGETGADVAHVQPGARRVDVETVLGQPVREWTSPTGIRYSVYEYDAGRPPKKFEAFMAGWLTMLSLGLTEVVQLIVEHYDPKARKVGHVTERAVLAYDEAAVVLGIFDEFDDLPADGRSGPREWPEIPVAKKPTPVGR